MEPKPQASYLETRFCCDSISRNDGIFSPLLRLSLHLCARGCSLRNLNPPSITHSRDNSLETEALLAAAH
jgi:hypothetical protein